MYSGVYIDANNNTSTINYNNIQDFSNIFNNHYDLLTSYKYDEETIQVYGWVDDDNIKFNFNTLPYYFGLRYVSSPLILISKSNDGGYTNIDVDDYHDLLQQYETDSDDESIDLNNTDGEETDEDEYDYNDGFLINDLDYRSDSVDVEMN